MFKHEIRELQKVNVLDLLVHLKQKLILIIKMPLFLHNEIFVNVLKNNSK